MAAVIVDVRKKVVVVVVVLQAWLDQHDWVVVARGGLDLGGKLPLIVAGQRHTIRSILLLGQVSPLQCNPGRYALCASRAHT